MSLNPLTFFLCISLSHSYSLFPSISPLPSPPHTLFLSQPLCFSPPPPFILCSVILALFPSRSLLPHALLLKGGNISFWLDSSIFCSNKGALVLSLPCIYLDNWFQCTPSWENYLQKATSHLTGRYLHRQMFLLCMFLLSSVVSLEGFCVNFAYILTGECRVSSATPQCWSLYTSLWQFFI